jgi:hypothetical protein
MVLVFLMSGPATNAATISTVTTVLGKKAAVIYLSSIILIAIIGGQLLDLFYQSTTFSPGKLSVEMLPWSAKIPSVVVLFGMIAFGLWNRVRRAGDGTEEHGDDEEKESCCRD